MGMARLIRRTAPLVLVGLAGAVAAKRRAERTPYAQLTPGPFPPPVARAEPVEETELAPWPDPEGEEPEEPAFAQPEPSEAASVTEIVDDLLAPGDEAERIEDATVVEGSAEEEDAPPDDRALAEAIRAALAEQPGLLPGTVEIDVEQGAARLSGEVERVEAITQLEQRAAEVPGIRSVRSFVHLPGTPPPAASEHR